MQHSDPSVNVGRPTRSLSLNVECIVGSTLVSTDIDDGYSSRHRMPIPVVKLLTEINKTFLHSMTDMTGSKLDDSNDEQTMRVSFRTEVFVFDK